MEEPSGSRGVVSCLPKYIQRTYAPGRERGVLCQRRGACNSCAERGREGRPGDAIAAERRPASLPKSAARVRRNYGAEWSRGSVKIESRNAGDFWGIPTLAGRESGLNTRPTEPPLLPEQRSAFGLVQFLVCCSVNLGLGLDTAVVLYTWISEQVICNL